MYNQLAGGYIAEGQSFPNATSHCAALVRGFANQSAATRCLLGCRQLVADAG